MMCIEDGPKESGTGETVSSRRPEPPHDTPLRRLEWKWDVQWACKLPRAKRGRKVVFDTRSVYSFPSLSTRHETSPPMSVSRDEPRGIAKAAIPELRSGGRIDRRREIGTGKTKFLTDSEMDMIREKNIGWDPESSKAMDRDKEVDAAIRPGNLRTRRAACKAPMATVIGREKTEERIKLCRNLSMEEVEEDYRKMTDQLPPRWPKKRRRAVQKLVDMLSTGSRLPKVITLDRYKVAKETKKGEISSFLVHLLFALGVWLPFVRSYTAAFTDFHGIDSDSSCIDRLSKEYEEIIWLTLLYKRVDGLSFRPANLINFLNVGLLEMPSPWYLSEGMILP
ncbi:hypothetical protein SAY86_002573 [Trapa natans]|uniref:Uncharacterized protein n=1 Tax=Trapa natans TaxID=22666 RepID=A0AAN7QZP8_TRANT|nr:hypothetical protein SAY86_002573 [Trapa natans]